MKWEKERNEEDKVKKKKKNIEGKEERRIKQDRWELRTQSIVEAVDK
jgi:hypothetical protein